MTTKKVRVKLNGKILVGEFEGEVKLESIGKVLASPMKIKNAQEIECMVVDITRGYYGSTYIVNT